MSIEDPISGIGDNVDALALGRQMSFHQELMTVGSGLFSGYSIDLTEALREIDILHGATNRSAPIDIAWEEHAPENGYEGHFSDVDLSVFGDEEALLLAFQPSFNHDLGLPLPDIQ